jgi:hypothetical protein
MFDDPWPAASGSFSRAQNAAHGKRGATHRQPDTLCGCLEYE